MKIGGSDSIDSLCHGHWKKLAEELNLGLAQMMRRLHELCGGVLKSTCENLNLPPACEPILSSVKTRANRIIAS